MKFIWDIIGYGLIATGLFTFFISISPMGAWIAAISAPAGEGIAWYSSNLEIVLPFGAFFVISDMNPRKMLIAGAVAAAIGGGLWLMGF